MTNQDLIEKIQSALGDQIQKTELSLGDAVVFLEPKNLPQVAQTLKEDADLAFDYLSDIRGVDYLEWDRDPRFEAVYELHSIDHNHSVRLRVGIDEDEASVPTISHLWKAAPYPERELYDMFGIHIEGLENLKRIIMPEDWDGHPLRKDYPLITEEVAFSFNRDFKKELVKDKPETRENIWL